MKEVLIALWLGILSLFGMTPEATMLGGGPGTINQLDQWRATTSPAVGITQNVPNKSIILTGLSDGCLELDGRQVTSTGVPCGSGGGGGGSATTTINGVNGPTFTFATGTATGIGLNIATSSGTLTFTPTVSSGYVIPLTASTSQWANAFASTSVLSFGDTATIDGTYNGGTGAFTASVVADSIGDTQLAFNTGQDLTTASSPTFNGLTVTPLTSALLVTNGSGVLAEYAGTSCTNQFALSLSALGVATCASVSTTTLTATDYTAGDVLIASSTAAGGWAWVATSSLGISGGGGGSSATTTINGAEGPAFTFQTGTAGSDFNIATTSGTVTYNIPNSGNGVRGLLVGSGSQTLYGTYTYNQPVTALIQRSGSQQAINYTDTTGTGNTIIVSMVGSVANAVSTLRSSPFLTISDTRGKSSGSRTESFPLMTLAKTMNVTGSGNYTVGGNILNLTHSSSDSSSGSITDNTNVIGMSLVNNAASAGTRRFIYASNQSTNGVFTVDALGGIFSNSDISVISTSSAGWFTATSTTATSTFPILSVSTIFSLFGNIYTTLAQMGTALVEAITSVTPTGAWNFNGATVKQHTYKSFTWPGTATTTSATTTVPMGTAYTAEAWNGVDCWVTSGSGPFIFTDGTNRMNGATATTTVARTTLSTNNTFTAGERRYVEIGPLTAAMISCTVDVTVNN